jgi:hypothetical protein
MKYEFHPEAEEELYEAAAYYEAGRSSALGVDFVHAYCPFLAAKTSAAICNALFTAAPPA